MRFFRDTMGITGWQFHNGRYKLIIPISITLKMSSNAHYEIANLYQIKNSKPNPCTDMNISVLMNTACLLVQNVCYKQSYTDRILIHKLGRFLYKLYIPLVNFCSCSFHSFPRWNLHRKDLSHPILSGDKYSFHSCFKKL